MEPADLLMQLNEIIASPSAADVFKSIYMDPLLFQSFEEPETMEKVAAACGNDPSMWNPARIGFALTDTGLDLGEISQDPLQPIPADLRQKVSALYQKVLRKQTMIYTVEESVFLALALRERRRLTESWSGLVKEITRNYTSDEFSADNWTTALAMTYWLCPDRADFLKEINSFNGKLDGMEYFILVSRILLSSPINTTDNTVSLLVGAAQTLDESQRVKALEWLYGYGFEGLTNEISTRLMGETSQNLETSPEAPASIADPLEKGFQFQKMDHLLFQEKVNNYQFDTTVRPSFLVQQEELLRQAQARMEAQKAALVIGEDRILAWKKVLVLVPESELAKAELAAAYLENQDMQSAGSVAFGDSTHPLVLAVRAWLASSQENLLDSELFFDQLILSLNSSNTLDNSMLRRIVDIAGQVDLPQKMDILLAALPKGLPIQSQAIKLKTRLAFDRGDYDKARSYASASLLLDGHDSSSRRILAKSYEKQDQFDSALQEWEKITSAGSTPARTDLIAYAGCAIRAGKPDIAISTCKQMIETDSSDGAAFLVIGDAHQQLKQYDQAGEYYEKAVSLSPELEETWNRLANYHLASGNKEKAVEILNTAIKAVPNAASLNHLLGCQYLEDGANSEAIPLFEKAYRIDPKNLDYIRTYGESLQNAGQWMDAEAVYNRAAKTYPFDQSILFAHAKSLLKLNKKTEALIPMQHLVELHPTGSDVYLVFGHLVLDDLIPDYDQVQQDDVETISLLDYSRDILQDASDREPLNSHLRLLLAENLAKLGEKEAARQIFASLTEQILTLPADIRWRVSYGLGMTSGQMGEFEVALAALQEAANQNPENFLIHQQLAEAYLRANLDQSALQVAQQALSINPKDPDNLIWYAEFCTRSHDLHEALSTLDAIIKIQPDNVDLRIKLGAMQIQVGEIEIAKATFKKLAGEIKLTSAQYQQIATQMAAQKEYQEAIGYLRLGIQEYPQTSLPLLMDLVQNEQKMGDLPSALNTLETAIGLDPQNRLLQIVKADMLAFGGSADEAIITLEQVNQLAETSPDDPALNLEQRHGILLRLAYLYRKTGAIQKAVEIAELCLQEYPGESEVTYLLADIAFHQLNFEKSRALLDKSGILLEPQSQLVEMASILRSAIELAEGNSNAAGSAYQSRNLNSRWYLWKSALDILTSSEDQLDLKTLSSVQNELNGLTLVEVDHLLPARDKHQNKLPDVPTYDPLSSSPLLGTIIADAAALTGSYETAHLLFDQLRDRYPYEIYPVFAISKLYVKQAEEYRLADQLHLRHHLPPSDSLSVGSFETFEEMILATERVSDASLVKAWHKRGVAAFYPTIDNFTAVSVCPEFASTPKFQIGRLALENKVADLMQYLESSQVSLKDRVEAAVLVQGKAPQDALQILQPVVDQLAIRPSYLAAYSISAAKTGNLQPAIDAMENALTQWTDEPDWHLLAAEMGARGKNANGALYHWKFAADIEPENYTYALEMGKGSLRFDDTMQAIQYLRKAAHLDPVNHQPWMYMAQAYRAHGDMNQAIASIERSVTLSPNKSEPMVYSAQLSLEAGQAEEALKKIDTALRLNPKEVNGLILKAKALQSIGHTEEALEWISHSLSKVADSLPLLLARSEIVQVKEGKKAYLKSLQEIAQDYPKDPAVLQKYAQALAENGQPADALHITQLALKADPDQLDMHLLAGRLLRSTGQLDQAIDHFSACVTIDSDHVESYLEMAKTYQERRDFPKASTLYEKVIEINPRDYRGYYQLGLLLRDAKDYRGAETMLRKASELTKEDVNILRQLGAIIALNLVHNPQEASVHS